VHRDSNCRKSTAPIHRCVYTDAAAAADDGAVHRCFVTNWPPNRCPVTDRGLQPASDVTQVRFPLIEFGYNLAPQNPGAPSSIPSCTSNAAFVELTRNHLPSLPSEYREPDFSLPPHHLLLFAKLSRLICFPYYLADLIYEPSRCLDLLIVTFLLFLPVLNHLLPLELFVYLRLIIGILSLCTSAHLTVLPLFNPALNLTFSLLPITSSHPHASASDSTFDFWRYVNTWLTLTLTLHLWTS